MASCLPKDGEPSGVTRPAARALAHGPLACGERSRAEMAATRTQSLWQVLGDEAEPRASQEGC